ncbi:hypothetical protein FOA52_004676 [Chlamydomonas sp. UWO 241]|nr:hypothetical protein FOA52_004676 [Chlamydomonas sp. UWO 241]
MMTGLFNGRKSVKDLTALVPEVPERAYPTNAGAYEMLEECGRGVSATVFRAIVKETGEVVAVKKMNLENVQNSLDEIVHEAQLMKNYHHPNVLPLYTSFVHEMDLWMVVPFVSGGSVLHIMKYAHPEGLDEIVIATIMRDVLRAVEYVHRQGGMHRDIKAGNILVDRDGCVYLGDFGVATSLERNASWGHATESRMTFVGTPCWMAPEVMEQTEGYNSPADIWSFGISLLEMAHGAAPFAKMPPMKVLLMTLQNPPPSLEDKGTKHFSKEMRNLVQRCLQKDPSLRPTATQLLEHKFFKKARDEEFIRKFLMADMPPLGDRVQLIRDGAGGAATSRADNVENYLRSQEEYKKGVSSWNFDVAAMRAQADAEDLAMMPTIAEADEADMLMAGAGSQAATAAAAAAAFVNTGSASPDSHPPIALTNNGSGAGSSGAGSSGAFGSMASVQSLSLPLFDALGGAGLQPQASQGQPAAARLLAQVQEPNLSTSSAPAAASPPSPTLGGSPPIQRDASVPSLPSLPSGAVKTKGRFSVYDEGDAPPRASTPTPVAGAATQPSGPVPVVGAAAQGAGGSTGGGAAEPSGASFPSALGGGGAAHASDDGGVRGAEGGGGGGDEAAPQEPKKKGRFTVIENSLERKPSRLSLGLTSESSYTGVGKASTSGEGTAPSIYPIPEGVPVLRDACTGAPLPADSQLLPRLQDLVERAAQQQAELAALFATLADSHPGALAAASSASQPAPSSYVAALVAPPPLLPPAVSAPVTVQEAAAAGDAGAAVAGAGALEELRGQLATLKAACVDTFLRKINWSSKTKCKTGLGAFPCPKGHGKVPGTICKAKITNTITIRANVESKKAKAVMAQATVAASQHVHGQTPKPPAARAKPKPAAAPPAQVRILQRAALESAPPPAEQRSAWQPAATQQLGLDPLPVQLPKDRLAGPAQPAFVPGMEFVEKKSKQRRGGAKAGAGGSEPGAGDSSGAGASGSGGADGSGAAAAVKSPVSWVTDLSAYNRLLAAMDGQLSSDDEDREEAPEQAAGRCTEKPAGALPPTPMPMPSPVAVPFTRSISPDAHAAAAPVVGVPPDAAAGLSVAYAPVPAALLMPAPAVTCAVQAVQAEEQDDEDLDLDELLSLCGC